MRFIAAVLGLLTFALLHGEASGAPGPAPSSTSTAVKVASVFRNDGSTLAAPRFGETLRLSGKRLDLPTVPLERLVGGSDAAGSPRTSARKRFIIAVGASALLPGLGELYLWNGSRRTSTLVRASAFLAVEGYLWYGYGWNHSKGKDIKQEYMDFADEHWNLERFLAQHPCCAGIGCESWEEYNAECRSEPDFFLYTPREADEEEYYENIGKYDAFVFGWDDWNNQPAYATPHRAYYWQLREDSDRYLLRADQHLMLLIVNRVASMVDAGWLAYRMGKGADPEKGWSIDFESRGASSRLFLGRRF